MADEFGYLMEYLYFRIRANALAGLSERSTVFTQSRNAGRYDLYQRLLQVVEINELPTYVLGIVRYSDGWLYNRMGRRHEAITGYEDSVNAFTSAGMPRMATDLWNNIGSLYLDQGLWLVAEGALYQDQLLRLERSLAMTPKPFSVD